VGGSNRRAEVMMGRTRDRNEIPHKEKYMRGKQEKGKKDDYPPSNLAGNVSNHHRKQK
jgi:hypothetical protein